MTLIGVELTIQKIENFTKHKITTSTYAKKINRSLKTAIFIEIEASYTKNIKFSKKHDYKH